jgi:hypothetical protein
MPRGRPKKSAESAVENFTPTEVARLNLLGFARTWIYDHIASGEIATVPGESGETRITMGEIQRMQALLKVDPTVDPDEDLVRAEHRERSSMGGRARAAKYSKEEMAAMRERGRRASLIKQADPEGKLSPAELERRIYELEQLHMSDVRRKGIKRQMFTRQYQRSQQNQEEDSDDHDDRREARGDQADS